MCPTAENSTTPVAVILTAIDDEYAEVRKHLTSLEELIHEKGNVYELGKFSGENQDWIVGIVRIEPGNAECAMETERAINFFHPELVLFVGVAGGIKDVQLGDVIAANKVYSYERGKVAPMGFQPRPDAIKSSYALYERAKAESRKGNWKNRIQGGSAQNYRSFTKPIAAGEKVVAETESEVCEFIRAQYSDAVAVEMEGSGFYTACQANEGISFLVVRGISDLLKNKSESDSKGYQEIAARNASAFAFEVLSQFIVRVIHDKTFEK